MTSETPSTSKVCAFRLSSCCWENSTSASHWTYRASRSVKGKTTQTAKRWQSWGLELSNTLEACDILSTTKRMVESLFSHGMFTTYCGFFGNPAPVHSWFIPLQSHYLPCFIVPNSYPAWCRISHPQRWPRSCTAWLNPPLKSLETWMNLDERIETFHGSEKVSEIHVGWFIR